MSIRGSIGRIHDGFLFGWAYNIDEINIPIMLELYVDGKLESIHIADEKRMDPTLKKIHPTSLCGFKIPVSHYFKNGVRELVLREKVSGQMLNNSPYIIDGRKFKNRILIVGMNKSGTSILTYRIASGLGTKRIYFEPLSKEGLNNFEHHVKLSNHDNLVTKCLFHIGEPHKLKQISKLYDKKVWIMRDPRDVLISSFFYTWYKNHNQPKEKFEIALERTIKKEKDPLSISFTEVTKGILNMNGFIKNRFINVLQTWKGLDKDWHKLKYESFIANETKELDNYLGFNVDVNASVASRLSRVGRSKSTGNWRNWFVESEIDDLKKTFNPTLEALGYDSSDWELNPNPKLAPSKGSEYMKKLYSGDL